MHAKSILAGSIIVLFFVSVCPALAQPGDCDGNAMISTADMVYLINYLYNNGPRPSMDDCDCDTFPGVNFGDLLQLAGSLFIAAPLYQPFGTDLPIPSHVKFYYNVQIPGSSPSVNIDIYVEVPTGFNVESFVMPFSFAPQAGTGQASATCNSISFTGTVGNPAYLSSSIDNINQHFIIMGNSAPAGTPTLTGGTSGLLCTANFTSGPGTPNPLTITSTNRIWPMLFRNNYYPGYDGDRVYLPEFIRALCGDVNCDGSVNIADAVWIITYIFAGGPPPCDCEPPE